MDKQSFFDYHASTWDEKRFPDEDKKLVRVAALAEIQLNQAVLDVATGTGVLVPHLLPLVGPMGKIVGIDLSSGMLEVARQKIFPANVFFLQADVHELPFAKDSFDRVICNSAFPHFADAKRSLREIYRVLHSGGLLVISHPIGRQAVNALHSEVGAPVQKDRVPSPDAMTALLKGAGYEALEIIDETEFHLARGWKP